MKALQKDYFGYYKNELRLENQAFITSFSMSSQTTSLIKTIETLIYEYFLNIGEIVGIFVGIEKQLAVFILNDDFVVIYSDSLKQ